MKRIINPQSALLGIGVMQPASTEDLLGFMKETFPEAGLLPIGDLQWFLNKQVEAGRVVLVQSKGRRLYSLSEQGNNHLPQSIRLIRDKIRTYLLRDAHRRKFTMSRTEHKLGLVGDAPTVDDRTMMKERVANKFGHRSIPPGDQTYWPRAFQQFQPETGPHGSVRDTFLDLISFKSINELRRARLNVQTGDFDLIGIGLCLGLSPALLSKFAYNPSRYYREFSIPKKNGGQRIIRSPRIFLKVVQWFLAEFVLTSLPVSQSIHSFRQDRSIASNAVQHEGQLYVANLDIEDFFGSITRRHVRALLRKEGFLHGEADAISRLVTYDDALPQGAPTSPAISNAILYEFDNRLEAFAKARGVIYSRYADDMTLSGANKRAIQLCIARIDQLLRRLDLRINEDKTRIASRGGQQRVTGVVVNAEAAPSRVHRRRIRAIFHHAASNPGVFVERTAELGGYIGYLGQFPKFQEGTLLKEYQRTLLLVRTVRRARRLQKAHSAKMA